MKKRIVIEIPDDFYKKVQDNYRLGNGDAVQIPIGCIANGTPLPEHHGNLKDVDSIFNESFPKADINVEYEENIKKYPMWRTDITGFQSILKNAPTIIEADKEVCNDKG